MSDIKANILFVAVSPIFSMGNDAGIPSLFELLKGLNKHTIKCTYLYPELPTEKNIMLEHITFISWPRTGVLNFFSNLLFRIAKIKLIKKASTFLHLLQDYKNGIQKGISITNKEHFDIVYCCTENALPIAWSIAKLNKIPLVLRSYGLGDAWSKIKNKKIRFAFNRLGLLIYLFRGNLNIIVLDGNNSHLFYEAHGIKKEKIILLKNGYSDDFYSNSKEKIYFKDDIINLGVCCRHDREKRIDRLLKVVPIIKSAGYRVSVHIGGSGPLSEELHTLCTSLDIINDVKFYGIIKRTNLPSFFEKIDIYSQLNQNSNFGNVLIEALISKCIVLTSFNDDQTKEMLSRKNACFEVDDPDNVEQIASVIINIIKLRHDILEIANRGYCITKEYLSPWSDRITVEINYILSIKNK